MEGRKKPEPATKEEIIIRYLDLINRHLWLITRKMGIDWEPKYADELAAIDAELKELSPLVEELREFRRNRFVLSPLLEE